MAHCIKCVIKPRSSLIFHVYHFFWLPVHPEKAGPGSKFIHAPLRHASGQHATDLPEGPVSFHCQYVEPGKFAHNFQCLFEYKGSLLYIFARIPLPPKCAQLRIQQPFLQDISETFISAPQDWSLTPSTWLVSPALCVFMFLTSASFSSSLQLLPGSSVASIAPCSADTFPTTFLSQLHDHLVVM